LLNPFHLILSSLLSYFFPLPQVMATKEYSAVAVTADKWIRTEEVPADTLPAWLSFMREQGYALVGLEQTHNSVSLSSCHFPRRCVLLLGNELRGVPPPLVALLDLVVEIPQRGTIRSLNVHVSASLVIAQYCAQHAPD
jgi:tRNA guanosine-2'-O-methyltransferase